MKYVIEISRANLPLVYWNATNWGGDDLEEVLQRAKDIIASNSGLAKTINRIRVVEVVKEHSRCSPPS